ncbi:MAG: hypothetical protein JO286_24370 [Solirubrobacterales bacterium]|nr:hypothetical protein [Solirubrobacterales bacterium]MBV9810334.1 hypothetical protein [Solirubrobacterales bacterium]
MRHVRAAFWVEAVLSACSGVLVLLTVAWPDWIEGVFGVDPDHHNGSLEWMLVIVCCLVLVCSAALARREWRSVALARGVDSAALSNSPGDA